MTLKQTDLTVLLEELYNIDPSLQEHEAKLKELLRELIANKPDTEFNEQFAAKLKVLLMERQAEQSKNSFFSSLFSTRSLPALLSGAVIMSLVLVPLLSTNTPKELRGSSDSIAALFAAPSITAVKKQAFGELNVPAGSSEAASSPQGMGGDRADQAAGFGGGGTAASSKMIVAPEVTYKYIYKGEEISGLTDTVSVYKRIKGTATQQELGQYLAGLGSDMIDLKKFGSTKLTNFQLADTDKKGYMIDVNMEESMISVNPNQWWWAEQNNCKNGICPELPRIQLSDMPSDEEVIAIATNFLRDYGVDTSNYGQAIVENDWKRWYEQMENKSEYYFPDALTVVFPFTVDGQTVYDPSGRPSGLRVNVNIRNNTAMGLWNLIPQRFEKSDYTGVTSADEILNVVQRGGLYGYMPYLRTEQTVKEVSVGTPSQVLLQYSDYDGMRTNELFIPALLFPIIDAPKDAPYLNTHVVVPLVKDILEKHKNIPDGPVYIMDDVKTDDTVTTEPAPLPEVRILPVQ